MTKPGKGVLDAAFSPDGKQLAVVVQLRDAAEFSLVTSAAPTDFSLTNAKPLGGDGCKVDWRPDALELAIVGRQPTDLRTDGPCGSCASTHAARQPDGR